MEFRSNAKIVDLNKILSKRDSNGKSKFSIVLHTDAKFSIVEDIPIYKIAMVSEAVDKKIKLLPTEDILEVISGVAEAYSKLYETLGLRILRWEVKINDTK